MIKLLGILDIISAVVMILLNYYHLGFAWIFALYLAIKAFMFISSIVSIIDLIAVIFFVLAIFGIHNILTLIFAVWILQKGFFSLLG